MSNLKKAVEHIRAAHACCEALDAGNVQHEDVLAIHAHVKAADGYLAEARHNQDYSLPLPADPDAEEAESLADPEERAARATTRASAAAVLLASGQTDAAQRLLRTPPERR